VSLPLQKLRGYGLGGHFAVRDEVQQIARGITGEQRLGKASDGQELHGTSTRTDTSAACARGAYPTEIKLLTDWGKKRPRFG